MDFLIDFFAKAVRLVSEHTEETFIFKRGKFQTVSKDEEQETPFDTFFLVPSSDVILYSLRLPGQVEENLPEVVRSFVLDKEPVQEGLKIDHTFIKEKGQLKVLVSVIREARYEEIRKEASGKSEELSGILPAQVLFLAHALNDGFDNGLCLFRDEERTVGFYVKEGFPVSFLKCRADCPLQETVVRFLSGLRVPDQAPVMLFGEFPELEDRFPGAIKKEAPASFATAIVMLLKGKRLPMVNLLPVRERKVHRKFWRYIAAAVLVIALGAYGTSLIRNYMHLRQEVQTLRDNYNTKKKQAMKLVKKIDQRDLLKKQVNFYNRFDRDKKKIIKVLGELTSLTPENTYATSINIRDNGGIDINGKSKDMFTLIRKLNESKYFKEVQKSGSSKELSDGYTAFLVRGKVVF